LVAVPRKRWSSLTALTSKYRLVYISAAEVRRELSVKAFKAVLLFRS
jgi:hypothetical protein